MIGQARQLSGRAAGGPRQLPGGTGVGWLGAVEVPDGAAVPGRGAATAAAAAAAAAAAGEEPHLYGGNTERKWKKAWNAPITQEQEVHHTGTL
ncbi:uncharacterized protein LOC135097580 isoform X2 [Scylla paramamosain]|uniref:uncharacterized protein LOC135097580 isoform X2 n=1 Tax=Scylla paramamosain TaxID=85552 RepID=UPI003083EB96